MEIWKKRPFVAQEQTPDHSKRRFVQLLAGTAAFTAAAYLIKFPTVTAQGGTVPPTATPEAPSVPNTKYWIRTINEYATSKRYPFLLVYDAGPEAQTENPYEVSDIFETWGSTVDVTLPLYPTQHIDMPILFDAMNRLNLPITELLCDPDTTPAFLDFSDKNKSYSFVSDDEGYKTEEEIIATIADEDETPSDENDLPLIVEPIEMYATATSIEEFHSPESFEDAIVEMQSVIGDGTTRFSKELYPYIRRYYDREIVDLATADGQFPDNADAVMISPQRMSAVMNLPLMGGYNHHAILMQGALRVALPDGYSGYQMFPSDLSVFFAQQESQGAAARPSVIAYPYSLNEPFIFNFLEKTIAADDPDETKTILIGSTYNRNRISRLDKPVPKGMICCTTVRKDENGRLFIPNNRSYLLDEDRMFGFPDVSNSVTPQLGAQKLGDTETELFLKYKPVTTSGASLSTLQATPFIGAVISKLMKDGNAYTEALVMNALRELCPQTNIDNAILRVPNIQRVQAFFGESLHIPQLRKPE